MKKGNFFLISSILTAMFFVTGCSKDEPSVNTDNDPEGTIIVSMSNYGIRINSYSSVERGVAIGLSSSTHWIAMTSENNFMCQDCSVASVGAVTGLGNVKQIPSTGYVQYLSVETGYGYVVKDDNGTYARLYVVEWIFDIYNEIIGAKVKYQYPWEPTSDVQI